MARSLLYQRSEANLVAIVALSLLLLSIFIVVIKFTKSISNQQSDASAQRVVNQQESILQCQDIAIEQQQQFISPKHNKKLIEQLYDQMEVLKQNVSNQGTAKTCTQGSENLQESIQCSICLEVVRPRQASICLPCSHVLHKKCACAYYRRIDPAKAVCPVCRAPVYVAEL